jgi:hypothetical protein
MIILANGKSYNTVAIFSSSQNFQGQNRDVWEIHFSAEEYSLEEISGLYNDPSPFSNIKIYEEATKLNEETGEYEVVKDEEGNIVYNFLSEWNDYTLPISLVMQNIDGQERYCLKLSQLSKLEQDQAQQGEDILLVSECILELSEILFA